MSFEFTPGQSIRVTIQKSISRDAAHKTIERLFMLDKAVSKPIAVRSRNFKKMPKRRGGQIWTKYPNKVHPTLERGKVATIKASPSILRDLASVQDFVEVAAA